MKVFLDMDGVLVNFNKAACAIINAPYPPTTWHWYENIFNGFERINLACTINFWQNLEWIDDGKEILRLVEEKFDDIYLLTTPMPNPESGTGKMLWIKHHLPQYEKRLILTQAPKSLLAGPNTLLIDDKNENIVDFATAGGKAILVPRPWNNLRLWINEGVKRIKTRLEEVCPKS